ncbi:hypothetical protein DGI_1838 [Megalodesulfovibrio gigas DSM 1382 = ATCC 19364]|uniref:Uncharacterized protein n=1 Tax=Megalodesulfovibrio gigas (strain ATCC 19364 / DSM 1382 / NCIMB 9332 / VKM B-1759) TaxID=1121448 RepID=T2GCL4_MEGG1|nr:hypothetical protein DGI_1838 [Megalodesulfovibrio gigas DSM 1382 = ATCC 19364]
MRLLILAVAIMLVAAPAMAETCQYNTPWGVLTLHFNYNNNTFSGDYPHHSGQVMGVLTGSSAKGQWAQSDGSGSLLFNFHKAGFQGKWNNASDKNWRGDWNGKLIRCWQ